jgi:hypothetical protein
MDSFELCRVASEKACWSYSDALDGLEFDFEKRFLPARVCGNRLPGWLSTDQARTLNQVRGFSYAHIFLFVEQFVIQQTCTSATGYVHNDSEALSALLGFSNEEIKHQRMFVWMKNLMEAGLGFRPGELPDKEDVARHVCSHSPFAVYLLILALEWLTQRHYVECFRDEEADLDTGFVRVFRLHWTEEAQHARLDAVQLKVLASSMAPEEIKTSVGEFNGLLQAMARLLRNQDKLDLDSIERALGEPFSPARRQEMLAALHEEWLWTFLVSGLEHSSFQAVYGEVVPEGMLAVEDIIAGLWTSLPKSGPCQSSEQRVRG